MWFIKDQRTNIIKTSVSKVVGLCLQILLIVPHSKMNTIWRTYVFNERIRKEDALTITQIKGV